MAHIDCSFYSPSLQKNAHVIAFIPSVDADEYLLDKVTDYAKQDKEFPTLYLLHGSYGDCMDWSRFTGIERYAQEKQVAVIMPSAENSNYIDMEHGEKYLTYVAKELPEFMRKIFPLSAKREKTFIAGLSMGGYGAFRCALEYPETFGYSASLSGALDQCVFQNTSEPHLAKMPKNYRKAVGDVATPEHDLIGILHKRIEEKREIPALYMSCGMQDFIYPANECFYQKAKTQGIMLTYEKFSGVHDWNYWDAHIKDVLNWLPLHH